MRRVRRSWSAAAASSSTLRLVAQYADACNLFDLGLGPEGIPHKLDVLRRHCDDVGRDYDEISKTCLARLTLDTGARAARRRHPALGRPGRRAALARCARPASTTSSSSMANTTDPAAYALVAEVVRQVA